MGKKLTAKEFVERAKIVHGDKYDYSKVDYKGSNEDVFIICPIHGACSHLEGKGCLECGIEHKTKKTDEFIIKAKKVHGDKYDYSETVYRGGKKDVTIKCPIHGYFTQRANSHLNGHGCKECGKKLINKSKIVPIDKLLKKFNEIHHNTYTYDFSTYIDGKKEMRMYCPIHGEFWQTPANHLNGHGCQKCAIELSAKKHFKGSDKFIEEAKKIHGDKYDYSKVDYKGADKDVIIICPIHGEFKQIASEHLRGRGCKFCVESKLENEVNNALIDSNIHFERQKRFKWLGRKSLDFYIPKYKIAIECQGEQHYHPVKFGGKTQKNEKELFDLQVKRDKLKKKLCEENNIKLFYFTHYEDSLAIRNVNNLIKHIKNNG